MGPASSKKVEAVGYNMEKAYAKKRKMLGKEQRND
jgi:hypothetical protein